jgi:hypothetical protein
MLNVIRSQNWQGKTLDSRLFGLVSEGFQKIDGSFVLKTLFQRQQHVLMGRMLNFILLEAMRFGYRNRI